MSKLHDLKKRFGEITAKKATQEKGHLVSANAEDWPIGNKLFATVLEVLEEQAKEIEELRTEIEQLKPKKPGGGIIGGGVGGSIIG